MHCGDQRHAGLCLGRRPCTSLWRVQGRSQGTTLSASDLHNARATILNPFYNMEYKIIKKMRQTTTWIDVDILGINLTPNRYVQCTLPSHCLRQQWRHNPIQLSDVTIATRRTLLRAHVNGTEIVWKSTDQHWNLSLFLYVQVFIHGCLIVFISRVIRWNCFSKMWRISLPRILQNNDLQC